MTIQYKPLALVFAVFATAFASSVPGTAGSQELVVNGGFEAGSFQGWDADGTCQVKPHEYPTAPTHKGEYSASLGPSNPNIVTKGSLSQIIRIPEDSMVIVSFWYRIEKQSSLDFSLREASGSIIQSWTFHETSTWTSFVYNLGPGYAGKSIDFTFEGKGFSEEVWVSGILDRPIPVRKNYYPYIDDVSVVAQSSSIDINVKASGLPSELSTKIFIDGRAGGALGGGESKALTFKFGDQPNLTAEQYVYESENVRYACKLYSLTMNASSEKTVTFDYTPQYRLTLESPHGMVEGSGWYDEEDAAKFSVSPETVPAEGVLGVLGVKYVFQGWSRDLKTGMASGQITMDSPKTGIAVWETDYLTLVLILGACAAMVALLFFKVYRKKR